MSQEWLFALLCSEAEIKQSFSVWAWTQTWCPHRAGLGPSTLWLREKRMQEMMMCLSPRAMTAGCCQDFLVSQNLPEKRYLVWKPRAARLRALPGVNTNPHSPCCRSAVPKRLAHKDRGVEQRVKERSLKWSRNQHQMSPGGTQWAESKGQWPRHTTGTQGLWPGTRIKCIYCLSIKASWS